jgi:hypothetical protein
MKKKAPRAAVKTMKAVKKKTSYRDAVLAIQKKMDEIKQIKTAKTPARSNPSLFRQAY